MKKLFIFCMSIFVLSGCLSQNTHKVNEEITGLLQWESMKSLTPIESIVITKKEQFFPLFTTSHYNFKVETYSGITVDFTQEVSSVVEWAVEAKCNQDNRCKVYVSADTLQQANIAAFEGFFRRYLTVAIERINNAVTNT